MRSFFSKNKQTFNLIFTNNISLIALLLSTIFLSACSQHNALSAKKIESKKLIKASDFPEYQLDKRISINISRGANIYPSFKISQKSDRLLSLTSKSKNNKSLPDGLWGQIVSRFEFYNKNKLSARTKAFVNYIAENPYTFKKLTSRAKPYLFYISSKLAKNGIPGEIALLPFVESLFQPQAISKVGASGLWQFTSSTGGFYGLRQNKWYDERFSIIESTQAAINLILDMYADFNSWPTALAAYNYGVGNIKRAIRKNRKLGLATDYWSLPLPVETKNYIPKLLAYAHLIANIKEYPQLQLEKIKEKQLLTTVEIEDSVSISTLANASKLSEVEFRHMNPGFKKWIIPPKENHKLLIPINHQKYFKEYLSKNGNMGDWHSYTVRPGDTLYNIAKSHKTKIGILIEANKLKKTTIYPGQEIIIPKLIKLKSNQLYTRPT